MGSLFKSKITTTKSPFETNPWEPQQDYLTAGFEGASGALDNAIGQQSVAGLNTGQTSAIDALTNQGMNAAQGVSQAAVAAGMQGLNNTATFGQNANQIYGDVSQDRTGMIMANGQQFAENPYMQGQIDSALGDVREAFDRDVSGINGMASATGNINSTRAGVLESRAMDDAMDRGAMISANMRGSAYENGLDRSMSMDQARTGNMMAANGQVGQSGQTSLDFANQGLTLGAQGAGQALDAQSILQGQDQRQIDGNRMADMDVYQRYMQLVGGNYGQSGFTTDVSKQPSIFQQAVGAAATYAGAGGTFCWVAREVYGEDDPKWMDFRFWLLTASPDWLFNLYTNKGEWFSGVVRKFPILKLVLRPLMNLAIKE